MFDAGKKVNCVIRETGNGPGMTVQVMQTGGIHVARLAGRWKNILTPPIFSLDTFWYRFLRSGKEQAGFMDIPGGVKSASKVPLSRELYNTKCSNVGQLRLETGEYV